MHLQNLSNIPSLLSWVFLHHSFLTPTSKNLHTFNLYFKIWGKNVPYFILKLNKQDKWHISINTVLSISCFCCFANKAHYVYMYQNSVHTHKTIFIFFFIKFLFDSHFTLFTSCAKTLQNPLLCCPQVVQALSNSRRKWDQARCYSVSGETGYETGTWIPLDNKQHGVRKPTKHISKFQSCM